ncbi:MAG: DegV family protein [Candidatus Eremiobacteraeota bacterium]|nr:DegV family protein [Candidatus Eremiobacteraeota bacterium]
MRAVALVTDSTADLDPNRAQELGVEVVPLFVNFGEKSFRDRIDITREEFYARLGSEAALPTTSQASAATYERYFAGHVAAGSDVVCISIAGKLSGTINAAAAAAAQFPAGRIKIVDSYSVSGGLMLLVSLAASLANAGRSADEIVAAVEAARPGGRLFAALPDLSHAVRTGRVSKAMAMLGGMMKIAPVITLDAEGKAAEYARVRTFARALETLVDASVANVGASRDARIAIVHARAPDVAKGLRERLLAMLPAPPAQLELFETGPAIAVHAGLGAAGIFSLAL